MAQQSSIRSLSEAEQYVIFECVFDYISDIPTLVSLSLVSKRVRSAIYWSNGLRSITFKCDYTGPEITLDLKGISIGHQDEHKKLEFWLRWVWNIGKHLKTLEVIGLHDSFDVLPLLNSLAANEKRPIKTIEIPELPCESAFRLVIENRNTLRHLCVAFWDHHVHYLTCSNPTLTHCSLLNPSERESFWSVVHQCERLESLVVVLCVGYSPIFPVGLISLLQYAPLKHLGLGFRLYKEFVISKSEVFQEIVDVLSSAKNLRENLESLKFPFIMPFLRPLVEKLACSQPPVIFANVTALTFHFLSLCCYRDPINWLAFWTVFPAAKEIKNRSWVYRVSDLQDSAFSQGLSNFCKTYLEVCAGRVCDIKIELSEEHRTDSERNTEELRALIAKAATLPEDQDWCTSHGVHIETELREAKVERVTLRKDASTLVFNFKFVQG